MKILFLILLSFSFYFLSANEALEQLINEAMEVNPGISELKSQIKALEEKEKIVQKWMDPMFAMEYSNVPFDSWQLDESPMSGIQFKVQQTFPLPGKNRNRKAVIASNVSARKWELEEWRLQLRGQLKKAYYRLKMVRELEKAAQEHLEILEQLIQTIRYKYETGKANQHDLLRIQIQRDKLQDELADYKQKERELQAMINSILDRDLFTNIKTDERLDFENFKYKLEELKTIAEENRPLLKKIEQSVITRRLEIKRAKWERFPDITLWFGYRFRQDMNGMQSDDLTSLGFSVPLPVDYLGRTKAKVNSSKYLKQSNEENYEKIMNQIIAGLESALSKLERNNEKKITYIERLIPDARTSLDATLSAYQTGRADFASLFQVQLQLINFKRILIKAETEAAISRVSIETLIGKNLKKGN